MLYTRTPLTFLFILFFSFVACSQNHKQQTAQTILLKPQEFNTRVATATPKTILDVRTPNEYKKGHLKDAILIDIFRDDFIDAITKLDTKLPIYVYCGVGGRSAEAAEILNKNGFNLVYDMDGGFTDWKKENLPYTQE